MIDCEEKIRKVSKDKAAGVASQLGVDYIETSSLENINIDKVINFSYTYVAYIKD